MFWWEKFNIKPLETAKELWEQTHPQSEGSPMGRPREAYWKVQLNSDDTSRQNS